MKTLRILVFYLLLVGGSLVFVWPFLWMAATSAKLDRELFSETIHFLPQRPIPRLQSPYVDDRLYADLQGPHLGEAVGLIEQDLGSLNYSWPNDLDRGALIPQTARGVYARLLNVLPGEVWEWPAAQLDARLKSEISPTLVAEIVARLRRAVRLGALRAESYDQQEDVLVPADKAATTWKIGGDAAAQLVPGDTPNESNAEFALRFLQRRHRNSHTDLPHQFSPRGSASTATFAPLLQHLAHAEGFR